MAGRKGFMRYIIDINESDKKVHIFRLRGKADLDLMGKVDESYGFVTPDVAAIYLAAIIHGFQPPRDLRHLDTPFD
jgi:hypothetical protein